MILTDPKDALHKAMLYRLLISILDEKNLALNLYFKGGTCAAMLGWLDRFSIDLDFDLAVGADKQKVRSYLTRVFTNTGFTISQKAKNELYFVLKYPAPTGQRSSLKLSVVDQKVKTNIYKPHFLAEIERYAVCQSQETMFANKLVAVTDRFKKYHTVAGRDVYDIYYFFTQGYRYNGKVITERTGKTPHAYLKDLAGFIEKHVTGKGVTEDLSFLLTPARFRAIRHTLKSEVLLFLKNTPAPPTSPPTSTSTEK